MIRCPLHGACFTRPTADADTRTAVRHTFAVGCAGISADFHRGLAHHAEAALSALDCVVCRYLAVGRRLRTRRHCGVRTDPDHDRIERREDLRDVLHMADIGFADLKAPAEVGQAGIDGDVSVTAGPPGIPRYALTSEPASARSLETIGCSEIWLLAAVCLAMSNASHVDLRKGCTRDGGQPCSPVGRVVKTRPSGGREGRQETALHQKAIRLVQGHHR